MSVQLVEWFSSMLRSLCRVLLQSPLTKASLLALCSNVDALAEHNMEALRAELALDSAFAAASPEHPDRELVPHAPDTDPEADLASAMDAAAPQRSSTDLH